MFCHFAYIFELMAVSYFQCCPFIKIFWELHRITCEAHDLFLISYMFEKREPHKFQNLAETIIFNKILFLLNKTNMSRDSFLCFEHLSIFAHSLHFSGNSLNFFESFVHHTSVSLPYFKCVSAHRAHTQSNCMYISVNRSPYPIIYVQQRNTTYTMYMYIVVFVSWLIRLQFFSHFLMCIRSTFI